MYYITIERVWLCNMASIIKKKVKKHIYYYLVESARVNGKPRIVNQKYLGSAEDIAGAVDSKKNGLPKPERSIVLEFGAVSAIYDIAKRLNVVDMINRYNPKRNQGLSVGEYMLLAAINRAIKPESKNEFSDWFSKTVLHKFFPQANKSSLSSQRFWDNMSLVTEEAVKAFEDEFSRLIVERYGLSTDCLIYDTTNFFTYIDTTTDTKLAKRGNSKQKRNDLKIVGLSMMVSPDFSVPLFHEVYPGNTFDSSQFRDVIGKLKTRYLNICKSPKNITLVFDKGNNSPDNMELLKDGDVKFNVVSSLRLNQCNDILDIPKSKYTSLKGSKLEDITAYRTKKEVYGRQMTVIATYNPELFNGQLQGIYVNIKKCASSLEELKQSIDDRNKGIVKKGRKPTVESINKRIAQILSPQYMADIFDIKVGSNSNDTRITIEFALNEHKFEYIKERYLGKSIIYTDNHDWETERIILAYRSQYHIEDAFKQMKNVDFLGFRPIYHWTDQKIMVHAFYCVLAFGLCCLLNKELYDKGIDISINRMLEELTDIKQVITIFPNGKKKEGNNCFSLSYGEESKKLLELLDLEKYQFVM